MDPDQGLGTGRTGRSRGTGNYNQDIVWGGGKKRKFKLKNRKNGYIEAKKKSHETSICLMYKADRSFYHHRALSENTTLFQQEVIKKCWEEDIYKAMA